MPTPACGSWNIKEQQNSLRKRLAKEDRTQQSAANLIDDIKLIAPLQHPRIVELVGLSWTIDHDLQTLYEYLPDGDLRKYLDLTIAEAFVCHQRMIEKLRIALDIAEALAFVHSLEQPLHHRTLKSRSVLLIGTNRANIGGFGAARIEVAVETGGTHHSDVVRWLTPEVVSNSAARAPPCDIYYLGVILTELYTHRIPYSDYCGP